VGRVTEFIHYINQEQEPTALEKKSEYSHIAFTERVVKAGKDYRKARKKERRKNEVDR